MNKNHSQKFSDEQLDRLIQTVLHSTIITDEEINEIADAPQFRRQILNHISEEKSRRETRWFFGWQAATAGAFLFLVVAGAAVWFSTSPQTETAAVSNEKINSVLEDKFVSPETITETPPTISIAPLTENSPAMRQKDLLARAEKDSSKTAPKSKFIRAATAPQKIIKANTASSPKTEIATEFIALSYLPASESGQIVRIKVPRSMLVSLGVSTNVQRSKIRFLNE